MNHRRWLGITLAVAMLTITGWYGWSTIAILYHKQWIAFADRRMEAINTEQLAGTGRDRGSATHWWACRVHHCDRLVALGYYFHESYQMDNLPNSFRMHSAILSSGISTFPARHDRYWSTRTNDEYIVIDVYDRPDFKSEWDAFAQRINDPIVADQYDERGADAELCVAR